MVPSDNRGPVADSVEDPDGDERFEELRSPLSTEIEELSEKRRSEGWGVSHLSASETNVGYFHSLEEGSNAPQPGVVQCISNNEMPIFREGKTNIEGRRVGVNQPDILDYESGEITLVGQYVNERGGPIHMYL